MHDLAPKVVPSDGEVAITLAPREGEPGLEPGREYEVRLFAMEGASGVEASPPRVLTARPEGGVLRFRAAFSGEQEHEIVVPGAEGQPPLAVRNLYSLAPDLFALRPFKGDLHIHSTGSDGLDAPAEIPALCRRLGLDFMALTDHRNYATSLEAIRAYEGVNVDLVMYPGEEVHPPDSMVHCVNFGGSCSVQEQVDAPTWREEVAAMAATLPEPPDGVSSYVYAGTHLTLQRIREAGGIAIFAHPYWKFRSQYNVPEALTARLFAEQPFDAYELLGGFFLTETESNALQVARYYEEAAQGRRLPIVGSCDGHGFSRGLHGWYYTVVLAASAALEDLRAAILALNSVAVEALPGMPAARNYGPFRLVKYVSFLMREVFPAHDELCREEGEWMAAYLRGESSAAESLAGASGRTARLYQELWA